VFGDGSPGTSTYEWQMPNPGGLPLLGNAGFSLTVQVTGLPAPGFAAIATARAATPFSVFGILFHLDPSSVLLTLPMPYPPPIRLALPIPNVPSAVGAKLFVQSFHLESASQIAATPGVSFTLL
jgi:hypothetical protein